MQMRLQSANLDAQKTFFDKHSLLFPPKVSMETYNSKFQTSNPGPRIFSP